MTETTKAQDTERLKMTRGSDYDPRDAELTALRMTARVLCRRFNASLPNEKRLRKQILEELLGSMGRGVWIEPPFQCDYGSQLSLGDQVYMNYNAVVLDAAPVTIGDRTMLGPGVQLLTSLHPIEAAPRRSGIESALPISIGRDVWIGGGVQVLPGVSIGDRAVIGAGSVVTKNMPADVVAAGNPCRVLRSIDNQNPNQGNQP